MMETKVETPEIFNIPEIELVYITGSDKSPKHIISGSDKAYNAVMEKWDEGKIELVIQCKVLLVNNAKKSLGIYTLSSGGRSIAGVDVRMIFAAALTHAATGIILCTNHPAGLLRPSAEEEKLVAKIKEGGNLLDISLLDFLIVSKEGYFSFKDEGVL